jgi:hypothetical protein
MPAGFISPIYCWALIACFLLLPFHSVYSHDTSNVTLLKRNNSKCYQGWTKDKLFGKTLVILGDSQGKRLMMELEKMASNLSQRKDNQMTVIKKQAHRCGLCKYLGAKCNQKWQPPPSTDIGPTVNGLKHPFCADCNGCDAVKWSVMLDQAGEIEQAFVIEFIPVEFAKDYTIQTPGKLTTQENVVEYLRASPPDYIIFNTGLHDMPYSTLAQYRANLKEYTELLASLTRTRLIWVASSLVNTKTLPKEYKVAYDNMAGFNAVADDVVSSLPNLIDSIDPTPFIVVGREFNRKAQIYLDTHHFHPDSAYYNSILMRAFYSICATTDFPIS